MTAASFRSDAGSVILHRALAGGFRSIAVVGTGKNVGKSVTVRSIAEAAAREALPFALTSIGRDGEAIDAVTGEPKPRFFLAPGAVVASAQMLLERAPAFETIAVIPQGGPLGPIVVARVAEAGHFEIAGSHTAAGMRALVDRLSTLGRSPVIIDGAIDRLAAISGGDDAVVVATGARRFAQMRDVIDELTALCRRLRIPARDPDAEQIAVDVLDAQTIDRLVKAHERRHVVVSDATKIVARGAVLERAYAALELRCLRPLRILACTVSPVGEERILDAGEFVAAAARATGLAVFDVVSGIRSE